MDARPVSTNRTAPAPGAADAVSVEDLADALRTGREVAVLDVREPWERAICRLSGSIDLPMARLPAALDGLPGDRELVVLCHHGIRSALAVAWLRERGIRAVNLEGGIDAWARRIDPDMRRY
jgi:rhodanese-related sulfurtransferase